MAQRLAVCRPNKALCKHKPHHSAHQMTPFRDKSLYSRNALSVGFPCTLLTASELTIKSCLQHRRWPAQRTSWYNLCWKDITQPFDLTVWDKKSRRPSSYFHNSKCAIMMAKCLAATWPFFWIEFWQIAVNPRSQHTWTPPSSIPFHPTLRFASVHGQKKLRDEKYISRAPSRSPGKMEGRSSKPSMPLLCLYSLSNSISGSHRWGGSWGKFI